jgi:hypothetical protein
MGLLEDAIREHLELKRLRGADPSEVAREQREALEPAPSEESAAWIEDPAIVGDAGPGGPGGARTAETLTEGDPSAPTQPPAAGDGFSNVGQETAELDMRSVLEDSSAALSPDATTPMDPDVARVVGSASSRASAEEDSLGWEMPERTPREEPADEHAPSEETTRAPSDPQHQAPEQGQMSL